MCSAGTSSDSYSEEPKQKVLNYSEILLMRKALEQYGLRNKCESDECLRLQYALKDAEKVVLFE